MICTPKVIHKTFGVFFMKKRKTKKHSLSEKMRVKGLPVRLWLYHHKQKEKDSREPGFEMDSCLPNPRIKGVGKAATNGYFSSG